MLITPVPCLKDNYAYSVNDNISKKIGVVDPSEAKPIIDLLERMNLNPNNLTN